MPRVLGPFPLSFPIFFLGGGEGRSKNTYFLFHNNARRWAIKVDSSTSPNTTE